MAITGLDAMTDDQAYRAMDLLVDADATAQVQEAVFFSVADLLNLEVDLLFFDTTSTCFESDVDDGEDGFHRYGHSKDHRPERPQIVIGLAVTREGIPVRVWYRPANTNDNSILPQVKDDSRGWRLGRVVTVVDRGFSSDANLAYLHAPEATTSLVNACATAPRTPLWRSHARAATAVFATTCESRKSASATTTRSAGSSVTTPTKPPRQSTATPTSPDSRPNSQRSLQPAPAARTG
ncbi:MAG: hypothetical protein M5U19_14910 [Microthrixaceae bacterium]|nr:hypothetical protein [Microthrixaceae bacterium]